MIKDITDTYIREAFHPIKGWSFIDEHISEEKLLELKLDGVSQVNLGYTFGILGINDAIDTFLENIY
jgi:hypothetical protein